MLTVPKSDNVPSFKNALDWAVSLGDAAKFGFGVIFRQPAQVEMVRETPVSKISIRGRYF